MFCIIILVYIQEICPKLRVIIARPLFSDDNIIELFISDRDPA